MKPRAYSKYKPSGIEWLGKIPEHWSIRKLKYITTVKNSNVDKKSLKNEIPVKLCNYIDVYYNDYITSDIEFMDATATKEEVNKFSLAIGDVIITKDSESWDDIAIPAYVRDDLVNVLCGYHLALIQGNNELINSEYLFRSFISHGINDQFRIAANGITRFGLGQDGLKNALFVLPPIIEQSCIAKYINSKTAQIDALIEKKQRQIELLREKRSALITHAVTKGLDTNVRMKDSGIEWLGEIPEGWKVKKLKYLFSNLDYKRIPLSSEDRSYMKKIYPYYGASGIIDYVESFIFDGPLILVAEDGANLLSRSTPLAFIANGKYWVNNHAHILKPVKSSIHYYESVLQIFDYTRLITGAAQPKLTADHLANIMLPEPSLEEQKVIASYIDTITTLIDSFIEKVNISIDKLSEYRSALITAAVTGKIDVRNELDQPFAREENG